MLDTIKQIKSMYSKLTSHNRFNDLELDEIVTLECASEVLNEYEYEIKLMFPKNYPDAYYFSKFRLIDFLISYYISKLDKMDG